jgi:hypothetical protein
LPEQGVEILNMRTDSAEQIAETLLTVNGKPVAAAEDSK